MPSKQSSLSFSLFDIEKAVTQRDYKTFEDQIITLLSFMDQGYKLESAIHKNNSNEMVCSHKGLDPLSNILSYEEKLDIYSRLASALTYFLSDTNHSPSNTVLVHFIIFKTYVSDIFYLSCFGNMDHILFNRGLLNQDLSLNLKSEEDIKFLYACLTLNTNVAFNAEQLSKALPNFGMYWYLGMLYGHHHSFNQRIENNLTHIINMHSVIQNFVLDTSAIELAASPWMLCSYLDRQDGHEVKKSINIAIEKWLDREISPDIKKKVDQYIRKTKEIKKIAIFSEKYSSLHAMYRCYHKSILELKKHYHLTLVSSEKDYDKESIKDFDDVIQVNDKVEDTNKTISKVLNLKPDMIIYTSLGMAKWTIPLCNTRLAKHQAMCYGHPASAVSKFIDYGIAAAFPVGPDYQTFLTEKLIMTGTTTHMKRVNGYIPCAKTGNNDDIVRIAINSSVPKISQRFVNLLILIKLHSSLPIEFHFYLIKPSLAFEKSMYSKLGPSAIFHQPKPYNEYMESLSSCDLALGTFPFGGSNTNIDLALLGIPKIIYTEDSGLASYSDRGISMQLCLPEELHTSSEGELLTTIIYLIHDSVERERLSNLIKQKDLDELVFRDNQDDADHMLTNAIQFIKEGI